MSELEKQFKPGESNVVATPDASHRSSPLSPLVLQIAHVADEVTPWGQGVKSRDAELRSFWPTEPILAAATYVMAAKISVLEWEIDSSDPSKPRPRNTANRVEQILKTAGGIGWQRTMMKLMIDLYTQDNGAFLELIRSGNSPTSPVVGIRHLDSARCYRVGDPETPVLYLDRDGKYHAMKWYQIISFEEMPSPIEEMYDVQYCAITRILRYAQLLRDISIFKREKVSGKNPGAIHIISGMSQKEVDAARAWAEENQLNQEMFRYIAPYIMGTINPEANLQHVELAMASLPDGYNEDETLKWYFTIIALGFGTDYQEFAPLASTNMGSGQQSEILHMKSRGKGPAAIISMFEEAFNNQGMLPSNVKFKFKVQDLQTDESRANARFVRAKDLALRVDSGVLSKRQAVMIAFNDGDISEHIMQERIREIEKEEREQQGQEQREQDPLTTEQVTSGMDRQDGSEVTEKEFTLDDFRTEMIARLQRREELTITDNPVPITEEDLDGGEGIIKRFISRVKRLFGGEDALDSI